MNTYLIHESNLSRVRNQVNHIRNKCLKHRCDIHYQELGEQFKTITGKDGSQKVARFIEVEAEGTAIINGWTFAGQIEHTEQGNIVRSMIDLPVSIPTKYFTCEPNCEHCQVHRPRRYTYLVYNASANEFKQVGSSCVQEFTHGLSAEVVAQYVALFDDMIAGEIPNVCADSSEWVSVEEALRYAYVNVKNLGYVSTSDPTNSTRHRVIMEWEYDHCAVVSASTAGWVENYRSSHPSDLYTREVTEAVDAMISYLKSVDDESEYVHNLKVIASNKYTNFKQMGYVVSIVSYYNRQMEQAKADVEVSEAHSVECESEYVGQVGEKVTVVKPSVAIVGSWDTVYGTTIRYKLTDETTHNIYMWDTSTIIESDRVIESIKGTIKKHDEYNGVKQTWIYRCRVSYEGD